MRELLDPQSLGGSEAEEVVEEDQNLNEDLAPEARVGELSYVVQGQPCSSRERESSGGPARTSSSSRSGLVKNLGKKYSSSARSVVSISSSPSFFALAACRALAAAPTSFVDPVRSFAFFVAALNAVRVLRTLSRRAGIDEDDEVEVEAAVAGLERSSGLMNKR